MLRLSGSASKKNLRHFRADGHPLQQLEVTGDIRDLALYIDRTPPGLTFTAPQEGSLLNTNTPPLEMHYHDSGSGMDLQTLRVLANDAEIQVLCNYGDDGASCAPTTGLPEGNVVLTATIRDYAGNPADAPEVHVTVDTIAPSIALAAPSDGMVTSQAGLVLIGALSELASLAMNGNEIHVGTDLGFTHGPVALQEGLNRFEFIALDAAGNRSDLAVHVTLDTVSPVAVDSALVEVGEVIDGHVGVGGQPGSVEPTTSVAITNTRTGQTVTIQSQSDGSFTATIAAQAGDVLAVTVVDAAGNTAPTSQMPVGSGLPQDPSTVAPALDRTVFTDVATATAFLYGGASPIQTGVAPETDRAAARGSPARSGADALRCPAGRGDDFHSRTCRIWADSQPWRWPFRFGSERGRAAHRAVREGALLASPAPGPGPLARLCLVARGGYVAL